MGLPSPSSVPRALPSEPSEHGSEPTELALHCLEEPVGGALGLAEQYQALSLLPPPSHPAGELSPFEPAPPIPKAAPAPSLRVQTLSLEPWSNPPHHSTPSGSYLHLLSRLSTLLQKAPSPHLLGSLFQQIGQAFSASRVALMQAGRGWDGSRTLHVIQEWNAPSIPSLASKESTRTVPLSVWGLAHWEKALQKNEYLLVSRIDAGASEQVFLSERGALSLAWMPIWVRCECWGLVGLEDCSGTSSWQNAELDALRVIAGLLGGLLEGRQLQELLHNMRLRYQSLFENVSDLVWELDPEGLYAFVSPNHLQVLGYRPEELLGKPLLELIHPKDRPIVQRTMGQKGSRALSRFQHQDGSWRWIDWTHTCAPWLEADPCDVVFGRDITSRRRTEELASVQRDLDQQLSGHTDREQSTALIARAAFRASGMNRGGVFRVVTETHSWESIYQEGLSEELLQSFIGPESRWIIQRLCQTKRPIYSHLTEVFPGHGPHQGRAMGIVPIVWKGQVLAGLLVLSSQFDEVSWHTRAALEAIGGQAAGAMARLRAERELRSHNAQLSTIVDSIPDFIFVIDQAGRLLYCNQSMLARLGVASDQIEGRPIEQILLDGHDRAIEFIHGAFEGESSQSTWTLCLSDKSPYAVSVQVCCATWNQRPAVVGLAREIPSDKKDLP